MAAPPSQLAAELLSQDRLNVGSEVEVYEAAVAFLREQHAYRGDTLQQKRLSGVVDPQHRAASMFADPKRTHIKLLKPTSILQAESLKVFDLTREFGLSLAGCRLLKISLLIPSEL